MRLRRTLGIFLGLGALVGVLAYAHAQQPAAPGAGGEALPAAAPGGTNGKTLKERSSYAIGIDIGRDFKHEGLDLDSAIVAQGIADALAGKSAMSDKDMHEAMAEVQKTVLSRRQEVATKAADQNKKDGDAFLAENKKREGVKTLASGLQYKILKQGTGATPKGSDVVTTNYRGTLLDGTEFDASAKHGGPATFPVKGVIPGWTEALQLMKEGDKWQLFIPPDLAYGAQGAPPDIGPNATLVFDIELVKVEPGQGAGAAAELPPK